MTEEETLVVQWMPLARSYAAKCPYPIHFEEKLSAAYEGLVRGVNYYVKLETPQYAPPTYIKYRIWTSLRDEMRRSLKHKDENPVEFFGHELEDGRGTSTEPAYIEEDQDYQWLLTGVTEKERELADLLAAGYTEADVSRMLGVSREATRQRKMTLRSKVEGALCRDEGGG